MDKYTIFFTLATVIGIIILKLIIQNYAIVFVEGFSMFPTLHNGDILLVKKKAALKEGNIYVFKRYAVGFEGVIAYIALKRLDHMEEKNWCYFLGDNKPDSYDSRHYGVINSKDVIGEVIKVLFRRN